MDDRVLRQAATGIPNLQAHTALRTHHHLRTRATMIMGEETRRDTISTISSQGTVGKDSRADMDRLLHNKDTVRRLRRRGVARLHMEASLRLHQRAMDKDLRLKAITTGQQFRSISGRRQSRHHGTEMIETHFGRCFCKWTGTGLASFLKLSSQAHWSMETTQHSILIRSR